MQSFSDVLAEPSSVLPGLINAKRTQQRHHVSEGPTFLCWVILYHLCNERQRAESSLNRHFSAVDLEPSSNEKQSALGQRFTIKILLFAQRAEYCAPSTPKVTP